MQVKKQQLELDMRKQTDSISEEYIQDCMLSPCLFNLYAECIMWNARLDEAQAGIKIARRYAISITSDMQMILPLWEEVKKN